MEDEDELCMEKCGVLHFGSNNLRNSASYALDRYRTLMGNRIWRIEWYHTICGRLRLPEVPEIALGTR